MAENAVNNEENVNSQSSQLEEEDLQKLEADCVPVNTKKQTSWGLKKFTQWLEKRKISCDLHTVSPTELNGILRKVFAEEKTIKKTDLKRCSNKKFEEDLSWLHNLHQFVSRQQGFCFLDFGWFSCLVGYASLVKSQTPYPTKSFASLGVT